MGHYTLIAALTCALLLASSPIAGSDQNSSLVSLEGNIVLPDGFHIPADTEIILTTTSTALHRTTFPNTNTGKFTFPNIPLDSQYILEVSQLDFNFPTFRIDVASSSSSSSSSLITVTLVDLPGTPEVPYPLKIRPLNKVEFFDRKQPFNVMGFLKTPYGMMIGFLVFSLVVLPMLKVDPEEYKAMVEEKDKLLGKAGPTTTTNNNNGGGEGSVSRKDR